MYIFNCIFTVKKVFSDDYSAKIEDDGFVWAVDGKYEELSDQKFDDSLFGGNKSTDKPNQQNHYLSS